jgi:hypothetical protein
MVSYFSAFSSQGSNVPEGQDDGSRGIHPPAAAKPERIITSLRDVANFSLWPGHKCPGYHRSPLWGGNNAQANF